MKKELTEEDIKNIAAQLRKPEGEHGIEIGKLMNDGNAPMNLHTLAVLNPQAHESILEIGMGNGYFVKNIVNLHPSIRYTGCDYSELMVEAANQTNADLVEQGVVSFLYANAQRLPFNDCTFDKIFTINTFYFWDNHQKVLRELKRVLKVDGTLIIAVRPKHNLELFPVSKYDFAKLETAEILDLLASNGFGNVEITEIKEPEKEQMGQVFARESLILRCKR